MSNRRERTSGSRWTEEEFKMAQVLAAKKKKAEADEIEAIKSRERSRKREDLWADFSYLQKMDKFRMDDKPAVTCRRDQLKQMDEGMRWCDRPIATVEIPNPFLPFEPPIPTESLTRNIIFNEPVDPVPTVELKHDTRIVQLKDQRPEWTPVDTRIKEMKADGKDIMRGSFIEGWIECNSEENSSKWVAGYGPWTITSRSNPKHQKRVERKIQKQKEERESDPNRDVRRSYSRPDVMSYHSTSCM